MTVGSGSDVPGGEKLTSAYVAEQFRGDGFTATQDAYGAGPLQDDGGDLVVAANAGQAELLPQLVFLDLGET